MFEPGLLKDKRILITGGGTGLGRAMAQRFLELGAVVYICGRRDDVLQQTSGELARCTGGAIQSFPCDVGDSAAIELMLDHIWRTGSLNILVNNASGNILSRTEELSPHAWEAVLGIVLTGTINMTMACGRRWLQAGRASHKRAERVHQLCGQRRVRFLRRNHYHTTDRVRPGVAANAFDHSGGCARG